MSFINFVNHELSLFRTLSVEVRRFLVSTFLFELIKPVLVFFTSTYIWRDSESMVLVILYYIAIFVSVVGAFYTNNLLQKHVPMQRMFMLGSVGLGMSLGVLFLLPLSASAIVIAGGAHGLAAGLYWANRHLIKQLLTNDTNRNYISALEQIFTLPAIVTPIIIGWILTFGETTGLYSAGSAYWLVMCLSTAILAYGAWTFRTVQIPLAKKYVVAIWQASPEWNLIRRAKFIEGLESGINIVLPTVMILYALGAENTVGTIMTAASLVATTAVYQIGKKSHPAQRGSLSMIAALVLLLAVVCLTLSFNPVWIVLYIIALQLNQRFQMANFFPVMMAEIDRQKGLIPNKAAYIADSELWVNAGRVLSLSIAALAVTQGGVQFGIKLSITMVSIAVVLFILTVKKITQTSFRSQVSLTLLVLKDKRQRLLSLAKIRG